MVLHPGVATARMGFISEPRITVHPVADRVADHGVDATTEPTEVAEENKAAPPQRRVGHRGARRLLGAPGQP